MFSFTSANNKLALNLSRSEKIEKEQLCKGNDFAGCLFFKTSYSHFKKTTTFELQIEDYDKLKALSKGNLAVKKSYGSIQFSTKVAISKKITLADSTSSEYFQVDAILKKYE